MSPLLQKILTELDQLTPEEQWQVMGHLVIQLQHKATVVAKSDESLVDDRKDDEWDQQMADDLESGRLDHVIAKVTASIEANQVRELNEFLHDS